MDKLLIVCGPTATGKTSFALEVAEKYSGELISADSRQVYRGLDIVTGKDIPEGQKPETSHLIWKNHPLKFYEIGGVKVWLYDVVNPDEPFNVSYWKDCADLVVADISSRKKLPIVIGGTGLYLKSLTQTLSQVSIPPDLTLRQTLSTKQVDYLFNFLNKVDSVKAASLNQSDRRNPRRLIRGIEIALARKSSPPLKLRGGLGGCYENITIGLSAPKDYLFALIDRRVEDRLRQDAETEAKSVLSTYPPDLPALTASGYRAFLAPDPVTKWKTLEHQYARRQLTWFTSQPGLTWFDISVPGWHAPAFALIDTWYNK